MNRTAVMQPKALKNVAIMAALAFLTACGAGAPALVNSGPDEFAVVPAKPLETPVSLATLPEPTPGGSNLADATPRADGIAALGGRAPTGDAIPASDAALVTYASRNGVPAGIREELAAADEAVRQRSRFLFFQGLFGGNRYFALYRGQALDQYKELERLRAAGIATPTAPPQ